MRVREPSFSYGGPPGAHAGDVANASRRSDAFSSAWEKPAHVRFPCAAFCGYDGAKRFIFNEMEGAL